VAKAICWIRRDLRLNDHHALYEACSTHESVVVVFVFDTQILDQIRDRKDRRVTFILESLHELDRKLRLHGSQLLVLHGDPVEEIPKLARQLGVKTVIAARDFEPYALQRDEQVCTILEKIGVHFRTVKDQVIFEKGEVLSKAESPFRVFTPYSRRWLERFQPRDDAAEYVADLSHLMPASEIKDLSIPLEYGRIDFEKNDLWLSPGEDAGSALLQSFENRISHYRDHRNFPAEDATSHLSVHFRFGTVSIREAVRIIQRIHNDGAETWLKELIWREFYQDILANHPNVVNSTFDPQYKDLVWPGDDEHFRLWCEGKTGYPLVDAAMRCFNETGWMHNRLRMIVASFLTKDLLIDYRKGEQYFADCLLDFDLASNNGGWQWAASVGCDAQPYFRIFNPYLQSRKFDVGGLFIRQWVPELSGLDGESIHCPGAMDVELCGYMHPIVDHDAQRRRAITLFETARVS